MRKWLLMLTLVSPALLGSTCSLSVRDAALDSVSAYISDVITFFLETYLPFGG